MTCHYIFLRGETYISIVYLYIQHYMFNYSWYIIINRNILFNAIVTRMNKYIIIIVMANCIERRCQVDCDADCSIRWLPLVETCGDVSRELE